MIRNLLREIGALVPDHCQAERVLVIFTNAKAIKEHSVTVNKQKSCLSSFKYDNFYLQSLILGFVLCSEIYTLQRHVQGEPLESSQFHVRSVVALSQLRLRAREHHLLQVLVLRSNGESVHMDGDRNDNLVGDTAAGGRIPGHPMRGDSRLHPLPLCTAILKPDFDLWNGAGKVKLKKVV